MTKTVLVGCGNMGHAMLEGWISGKILAPSDVTVVEPNEELRARAGRLGVTTAAAAVEVVDAPAPDLVILAVKPQVMRPAAEPYRPWAAEGTAFLSVAAGIPTSTLSDILGPGSRILRCMPNTPAAIGKGMMVVYAPAGTDERLRATVETLLAASGRVAWVEDESLMDAVTAVSGSGPAYVFHFIECLADAGVAAGLPAETARLLAMQTVYGAACLAADSSDDPATLRRQVTSPNGTTAAALEVLMGGDRLKDLVREAVEAARLRGIELGK